MPEPGTIKIETDVAVIMRVASPFMPTSIVLTAHDPFPLSGSAHLTTKALPGP